MLLFGYHKEFIFKERGFFKVSQNKNPSKITRYAIIIYTFNSLLTLDKWLSLIMLVMDVIYTYHTPIDQ